MWIWRHFFDRNLRSVVCSVCWIILDYFVLIRCLRVKLLCKKTDDRKSFFTIPTLSQPSITRKIQWIKQYNDNNTKTRQLCWLTKNYWGKYGLLRYWTMLYLLLCLSWSDTFKAHSRQTSEIDTPPVPPAFVICNCAKASDVERACDHFIVIITIYWISWH